MNEEHRPAEGREQKDVLKAVAQHLTQMLRTRVAVITSAGREDAEHLPEADKAA